MPSYEQNELENDDSKSTTTDYQLWIWNEDDPDAAATPYLFTRAARAFGFASAGATSNCLKYPLRDFQYALGRAIRIARRRCPLTQAGLATCLADRLGHCDDDREAGQSSISRLESNCGASMERLGAVASIVGIPPSGLAVAADLALQLGVRADRNREVAGFEVTLRALFDRFSDAMTGKPRCPDEAVVPEYRPVVSEWLNHHPKIHDPFATVLGRSIKIFRHRRHMTQTELAQKLQHPGSSPSNAVISQIEKSKYGFSWERLVGICAVLKVNLAQLFSVAELLTVDDTRPMNEQLSELSNEILALEGELGKPGVDRKLDQAEKESLRQQMREIQRTLAGMARHNLPQGIASPANEGSSTHARRNGGAA
jgi:transcriptional regulator with XRE-family HTH domain